MDAPFHSTQSWATLRLVELMARAGAERGGINGAGAEMALCNGEVSVSTGNRKIIKLLNYFISK